MCQNLVRDQGVGGSNPLSPTNFKTYESSNRALGITPCGLVQTRMDTECSRAVGRGPIYKNDYVEAQLSSALLNSVELC